MTNTYFYDANLKQHVVCEPGEGTDPAPCKYDDIDITLGSTLMGEPAIIFYRPDDWSMLGYIFKRGNKLNAVYTYIQDARDYLFKIIDGDRRGEIICNHRPDQLKRVAHDYAGHDNLDMFIREKPYADYNHITLYDVEEVVLMDKTSDIMSIKHSDDDGKHVYTVEMLSCEKAGDILDLHPLYRIDIGKFEQCVFKAYPGVKTMLHEAEQFDGTLIEFYNNI